MLCKRSDSQKNTMSLHFVQSEPLTSGVTVLVQGDGMKEKFKLSFYNQALSTGEGSATWSFNALLWVEAVAQCSMKGKWCEMVNRTLVSNVTCYIHVIELTKHLHKTMQLIIICCLWKALKVI